MTTTTNFTHNGYDYRTDMSGEIVEAKGPRGEWTRTYSSQVIQAAKKALNILPANYGMEYRITLVVNGSDASTTTFSRTQDEEAHYLMAAYAREGKAFRVEFA